MTSSPEIWTVLNIGKPISAKEIVEETRATGKPIRQAVAWMHNTLYTAAMKKAGSVDNLIATIMRVAGPNEAAAAVLRDQLKQCAILRDVFADAHRAILKSESSRALALRLPPKLAPWFFSDTAPKHTYCLITILSNVLAAAYGVPDSIYEAISDDSTLTDDVKTNILAVIETCDQLDEYFRRELQGRGFELSDKAWSAFAETLSSGQRGLFLLYLQLTLITLFNWSQELDKHPSVAPLLSAGIERMEDEWGAVLNQVLDAGKEDAQAKQNSQAAFQYLEEQSEAHRKNPKDFFCGLGAAYANAWKRIPEKDARVLNNALLALGRCCIALSLSCTSEEIAELCKKDTPLTSGSMAVDGAACFMQMGNCLFN